MSEYLALALASVSLIGTVAAIYQGLRKNGQEIEKQTIQQYKDAVNAYEQTVARVERERGEDRQRYENKIVELTNRLTSVENENKILRDSVTGKVQLDQIQATLLLFADLLKPDGVLAKFEIDHRREEQDLADIKKALKITNRNSDGNP